LKGIVLAGGSGSRLDPITRAVSKQLVPVYDKPMIYYPLSVLMLAGIREVLVISTPVDLPGFRRLFGDGGELGMSIRYAEQPTPRGLADAFVVGRDFVGRDSVALILGDNIFFGAGLAELLRQARNDLSSSGGGTGGVSAATGAVLFGYQVQDPQRYGVAEIDGEGNLLGIEEKPREPKSHLAVTGLYFYDNQVVDIAAGLRPSARGEIEITDVNNHYIAHKQASMRLLGRGYAWLDTGTPDSLLDAAQFVAALRRRQGTHIACIEEIAFVMGFIDDQQLMKLAEGHGPSPYGRYLAEIVRDGV
jgi:glucose-1-phosphate thymidylyltransferase